MKPPSAIQANQTSAARAGLLACALGTWVLTACQDGALDPSPVAPTRTIQCDAALEKECQSAEAPDAGTIVGTDAYAGMSRPVDASTDSQLEAETGVATDAGADSQPQADAGVVLNQDAGPVASDSATAVDAQTPTVPPRRLGTILSLGDSITVGFSGGYQAQVSARLKAAAHPFQGDIINDGHSGWQMIKCSVDGIYQILEPDLAKYKPDTVLLMIGTNDVGGANAPNLNLASIGHPEVNCGYDAAPERLNLLLEKIHEQRPSAMIFVANIIPIMRLEVTQMESEKYAPKVAQLVNKRIAAGDKLIAAVDVWTNFPRATGYQDDKVHPNAEGQRFIGDRFFEGLARWLE